MLEAFFTEETELRQDREVVTLARLGVESSGKPFIGGGAGSNR